MGRQSGPLIGGVDAIVVNGVIDVNVSTVYPWNRRNTMVTLTVSSKLAQNPLETTTLVTFKCTYNNGLF